MHGSYLADATRVAITSCAFYIRSFHNHRLCRISRFRFVFSETTSSLVMFMRSTMLNLARRLWCRCSGSNWRIPLMFKLCNVMHKQFVFDMCWISVLFVKWNAKQFIAVSCKIPWNYRWIVLLPSHILVSGRFGLQLVLWVAWHLIPVDDSFSHSTPFEINYNDSNCQGYKNQTSLSPKLFLSNEWEEISKKRCTKHKLTSKVSWEKIKGKLSGIYAINKKHCLKIYVFSQ